MIEILVSNQVFVDNLPEIYKKKIKSSMTIENPAWHIMRNMGKSVYATPQFFTYYEEKGQQLILPRGSYLKLTNFLDKYKAEYTVKFDLVEQKADFSQMNQVLLRDYQKPIVDKVVQNKCYEGIIAASTGSGKTILALEIARRLGVTTTILVPTNVILSQFVEDSKNLFWAEVGIVNGLNKQIKPITIASYQTLARNKDLLATLSTNTSLLFTDECHGVVSPSRRKIISAFKPRYLYGLSGTPERTDAQTRGIFYITGDIIESYQATQMNPTIEIVNTRTEIPVFQEGYHKTIDAMVENKSRNKLIAGLVLGETVSGRRVLVLTKRIQHYKNIKDLLIDSPQYYYIDSEDKRRLKTLMEMKSGERKFSAIFGTTSLLSVGADIPSLDTLIIACDLKSSVLLTQSAGRILRLFGDKQHPKIIDLADNYNPILRRQATERFKLYQAKGWKIIQ